MKPARVRARERALGYHDDHLVPDGMIRVAGASGTVLMKAPEPFDYTALDDKKRRDQKRRRPREPQQ